MVKYAIIQGRLTDSGGMIQCFPDNCWEEEFTIAKRIGFDAIELLVDGVYNPKNPIWHDSEIKRLRGTVRESGVETSSLCVDHIMRMPLTDRNERVATQSKTLLARTIKQAHKAGVQRIVLPFLEEGSLHGKPEELECAIGILTVLVEEARELGITLSIEDDLTFSELKLLLGGCPRLGICYDTGNRVSLGYVPQDEIRELGPLITHVHIKDKNDQGENVWLGDGLVDFREVTSALKAIRYDGLLTLENSRGEEEQATAKKNLRFIRDCMGT